MVDSSDRPLLIKEFVDPPLSTARIASGRLRRTMSSAIDIGADNLLNKALVRLECGDVDAARPFVARALALPDDDFEERPPGLWAAHMKLFSALSDDLEGCDPGDHSWLRRAETLIERSTPDGVDELRLCLREMLGSLVALSSAESKRVKQLTVGLSISDEPFDGVAEGPAQEDAVLDVLRALIDHEALLAEALDRL